MTNSKSSVKGIIAIVVIAVAVFLIYKYGLKPSPGAPPDKTQFICTECGYTFEVSTNDTTRLQAENPNKNNMIKCPECGRFAAKQAILCPYCEKPYLPQESLQKYGEKYRCTHCGKRLGEE